MLGLNRNTLRKKIRELDLPVVRGLGAECASRALAGHIRGRPQPRRQSSAGTAWNSAE